MSARAPRPGPEGDRVVAWIERHLSHVSGQWAGQPLRLAPWQADRVIRPLFGVRERSGLRRYRSALIGVPRKAGKSTLGAAIALRLLTADGEPGAEVYSAAADREQARIVFGIARRMVEQSPALSRRVKVYRNSLVVEATGARYQVLSSDAFTKHGLSPSGVIFDELHAQPDRELWDVLTTGQGARRQPLTVAITTAGFDETSICYELYDYGRRVARREVDDPSFLFAWWGAGAQDDWRDEATWAKAQPNLGVSVSVEFMRREAAQAEAMPARQNTFRRLYLNQWTQASTRWLDLNAWDASAGLVSESALEGRRCFGGLDLASVSDFTAWVLVFPAEDGFEVACRFFLPAAALKRRSPMRATLQAWARNGFVSVTDGDVADVGAIEAQMDADRRRFDIAEVAYDPWEARDLVGRLTDAGWPMIEWPQSAARMNGPAKQLEELVARKALRHGGNPVLRWQADNVVVRIDGDGRIKPDRRRSVEKIDGIVALVMALGAATRQRPAAKPSLYGFDPSILGELA